MMKTKFVDQAEFWKQMCSFSSFRLDKYSLANRDVLYITDDPPENDPMFFSKMREDSLNLLGFDKNGDRLKRGGFLKKIIRMVLGI